MKFLDRWRDKPRRLAQDPTPTPSHHSSGEKGPHNRSFLLDIQTVRLSHWIYYSFQTFEIKMIPLVRTIIFSGVFPLPFSSGLKSHCGLNI